MVIDQTGTRKVKWTFTFHDVLSSVNLSTSSFETSTSKMISAYSKITGPSTRVQTVVLYLIRRISGLDQSVGANSLLSGSNSSS